MVIPNFSNYKAIAIVINFKTINSQSSGHFTLLQPINSYRFFTTDQWFTINYLRFQYVFIFFSAFSRQPSAVSGQPSAVSRQQQKLLPLAFCLLPFAFCLARSPITDS
ncbi:hypothetical protein [Moorena sp. SIO3H5]|uniref:hypothetical protein n=1 Tax=Moorena sp. SIO3H5 TaxID=2607834 RepID=UPI0013B5BBB6|nr:hypothetical protein [Moorena sp. SIO3H5]NEO69196.1 hypothetical protein [Moorena sp. SIO3H5]